MRQSCCPWGEVRFGATESDGRLSGVRFFRSVAFADATGSGIGWIGLSVDQNRHSGRSADPESMPC
ncbi:hypothetical protein [Thalassospira lucentensis]|uniref:hypothetical protein n=1 Tax=Thalassospira lucentensis TaxID=168935 RepID=UPI0029426B43|nr:hypothetical protein [Thalassospira lucentensis]WOI10521.1 hypothetical protein R1T41_18635 [Thalassospira lucentensis]